MRSRRELEERAELAGVATTRTAQVPVSGGGSVPLTVPRSSWDIESELRFLRDGYGAAGDAI